MNQPEPSAEVIEAAAEAMRAEAGSAGHPSTTKEHYRALACAALNAAGAAPSETDLAVTNLLNAVRAWHVEKHITDQSDITTSECSSEVCRRAAYVAWRRAALPKGLDEAAAGEEFISEWDDAWVRWMEAVPPDWKGAPIDLAHEAFAAGAAWREAQLDRSK